jgi:hypothetical protein
VRVDLPEDERPAVAPPDLSGPVADPRPSPGEDELGQDLAKVFGAIEPERSVNLPADETGPRYVGRGTVSEVTAGSPDAVAPPPGDGDDTLAGLPVFPADDVAAEPALDAEAADASEAPAGEPEEKARKGFFKKLFGREKG